MNLKGSTAVVTGGASGIGNAILKKVAAAGAKVVCADIDEAAGTKAAEEIKGSGGEAIFIRLDITNGQAIKDFAAQVIEQTGGISMLINAAGGGDIEPFATSDPDEFDWNVSLNYTGPVKLTHALLDSIIESGNGNIVYISSDAGRVGSSGESVYAGGKGGIIAFTKSLAREVARAQVNVNCVSPGPTDTPLLRTRPEKLVEAFEKAIPFRRFATPDDIANAVLFLCSDEAGFITAQDLIIDGGATSGRWGETLAKANADIRRAISGEEI